MDSIHSIGIHHDQKIIYKEIGVQTEDISFLKGKCHNEYRFKFKYDDKQKNCNKNWSKQSNEHYYKQNISNSQISNKYELIVNQSLHFILIFAIVRLISSLDIRLLFFILLFIIKKLEKKKVEGR